MLKGRELNRHRREKETKNAEQNEAFSEQLEFIGAKTITGVNGARQRRKIEAYFLGGEDSEFLDMRDVEVPPEYEAFFLQKLRDGEITKDKKGRLLSLIQTPLHEKNNHERVLEKIKKDSHQEQILSMIAKKGEVKISDLSDFAQNFATPLDFEGIESDILKYAKNALNTDDYKSFADSMNKFKHNVYGKRQECYEQLQFLEKMAKDKFPEETKKHEIVRKNYGIALVSKGELFGEDKGMSEDSYFINEKKGIYAVFDGVGGSMGGSAASKCASDTLQKICKGKEINLEQAMQSIHRSILDERHSGKVIGQTTAVIAQINSDSDGKTLDIASIGDSRLYLVRGEQIYQLTHDDGITEEMLNDSGVFDPYRRQQLLNHGISKCLGDNKPASSKICSEGNYERYQLEKGDRIMICSDGITGDTEEDYMYPEEIQQILNKNPNDQLAAQALMESAKKMDDRTVIVITA